MKSKRVAKLLACALTVAMSTTAPVFAASIPNSGKITTSFGVNSPTLTVTLDTTTAIKVNPLYNSSATNLNKYKLASKNISVNNRSVDDDGVSINVMVTATAKITSKGTGVKAYYDTGASSLSKFVGDDKSTAKSCYMELQKGTGTSANQAQYAAAPASGAAVVTTQGSRLQFKVDEATATAPGYGEFAIVGDANTQAGWDDKDLAVEMTYDLKPATEDSGVTGTNAPTMAAWVATSGNALSINNFVTDANLAGASIVKFTVYDPKMDAPEVDMAQDAFIWKRTSADDGYDLTVPKDDAVLTWLATKEQKGKEYGLLMTFTDGRVAKTTIKVQ